MSWKHKQLYVKFLCRYEDIRLSGNSKQWKVYQKLVSEVDLGGIRKFPTANIFASYLRGLVSPLHIVFIMSSPVTPQISFTTTLRNIVIKNSIHKSGTISILILKRKLRIVKNIKKQIYKFALTNDDIGIIAT